MNVSTMLSLGLAMVACAALPAVPLPLATEPGSVLPWRVVGAVLGPARARADEDTAALVRRGIELRRRGDDEGAVELFWQAWAIDPQPRSCAQLALAEQAVGSFVEAERHLMQALLAEADPWIVRHRPDLELALATIRSRLGSLVIRGGVVGAEVRVDGALVGTLPLSAPIRLPAGRFRIDVSADAYYSVTRFVTVVPEQIVSETLVLVPDASSGVGPIGDGRPARGSPILVASGSSGEPPRVALGTDDEARHAPDGRPGRGDPTHRRRRVAGWSVIGLGGALLAASGASFGIRERAARDFNAEACLVGEATRGESCGEAHRRAIRAERASLGTLIGGAAFAATGTVLLVLAPDARSASSATGAPAPRNARSNDDVGLPLDAEPTAQDEDADETDRRDANESPGPSPAVAVACAARLGAIWGGECAWTF